MKTILVLIFGTFITTIPSTVIAQVFASGQVNTSYIYPSFDENGPERLFTGISAEIGAEGSTSSILLKSGMYFPRNYAFESYKEDGFGSLYYIDVEQRVSILELGLYGRYYLIGQQGNVVRIFTNSGLEMVWARAKDEYLDIFTDVAISEKFTNKQLRAAVGLGFEIELDDNLFLLNDFLFKYPFTDMDSGGIMFIDVASDAAINYNVGLKIYLD